tara:strand:- start:690 stop:1730 length:1041 start_codon:yes stop_codon:yes gene_type:complete
MNPWSKKHKAVTKASSGGMPYSLSNSFAEPLTHRELVALTLARGDDALVAAYSDHSLKYTPNGGSHDLRAAIAEQYGASITAEHVLVFTGAQVALQTAALALAAECHTIVFTPGYQSTIEAPSHFGGNVTQIPLSAAEDWAIDLVKVERAIVPGVTKYLVLNVPHNPSGTLISRRVQIELAALCDRHGIYVLCDEVYRLLEHDPADRLPAFADLYRRGISCVTLSKPWGGCGITIGWLAFSDLAIKQRLVDVQYFNTACPARSSELQALMVLRASDEILKIRRRFIRSNFELLHSFMVRYAKFFSWVQPKAGAIAFVKFNGPLTTEELGYELAEVGISIKPACVHL